jgi:uncharacterized protein YkwD
MLLVTTATALAMVTPWLTTELALYATEQSEASPTLLQQHVSDASVISHQVILTSIAKSKDDFTTGTGFHTFTQTSSVVANQPTSTQDTFTPTVSPTDTITPTVSNTTTHTSEATDTCTLTATRTKIIPATASPTRTFPPPTLTSTNTAQNTSTVTHTPPPPPPATDTPLPFSTPTSTSPPLYSPTSTPPLPYTPTYTPNFTTPTQTPEVPTSTPTSSGSCNATGNSSYENTIVSLINQERTDQGLHPLTTKGPLTAAARIHSTDMACNGFISHTGSDGSRPSDRVAAQGYSFSWIGENIYAGGGSHNSPQSAFNWWMNSTPHYNNMLSPNYQSIGVGYMFNSESQYRGYFTVVFARP